MKCKSVSSWMHMSLVELITMLFRKIANIPFGFIVMFDVCSVVRAQLVYFSIEFSTFFF